MGIISFIFFFTSVAVESRFQTDYFDDSGTIMVNDSIMVCSDGYRLVTATLRDIEFEEQGDTLIMKASAFFIPHFGIAPFTPYEFFLRRKGEVLEPFKVKSYSDGIVFVYE